MAEFIPVPNCARVELVFTQGNIVMENVFHVRNDTPFDAVSLALCANVFKTWYVDELLEFLPSSYSLNKIIAKALDSDSAPGIEFTTGLPLPGGSGSAPSPNNVTMAVKWTTGLIGRSYRGRTYHVGLTESSTSGDTINSEWVSAATACYQALLTALDSTPYELVVVSKYHNNAARATGVATQIAACSIDPTVDSQRRRLAGRGR